MSGIELKLGEFFLDRDEFLLRVVGIDQKLVARATAGVVSPLCSRVVQVISSRNAGN